MKTQIKHSKGYWLVYKPQHPHVNKSGYIPKHRFLMEKHIERYINPLIEDVHHIDENPANNNLNNLILLTKSEHRRFHNGWKKINEEWWKTCQKCERFLKVEDNFYKRHTGHNEFVTSCKDCCRKISLKKGKIYYNDKKNKSRTIICPICGKEKQTFRYAKTTYCSIKCAWIARKGGD